MLLVNKYVDKYVVVMVVIVIIVVEMKNRMLSSCTVPDRMNDQIKESTVTTIKRVVIQYQIRKRTNQINSKRVTTVRNNVVNDNEDRCVDVKSVISF